MKKLAAIAAVLLVLAAGGCAVSVFSAALIAAPATCAQDGAAVLATSTTVAGLDHAQTTNAALIINAGAGAGVGVGVGQRGQVIAVMTALGESGLRVLTYGDVAGPDSRGLFQQRANGAWGTLVDRMDPTTSATNFYKALLRTGGWQTLAPTIAAHRVQGNADPYYYATFWDRAVQIVTDLSATTLNVTTGTGAAPCSPAGSSTRTVTAAGWANPVTGQLTSPFGMRVHPTTGTYLMHWGQDIAAPCGTPIYAAGPGVVTAAGPASGYGHWITIDHGGNLTTVYGHMYASGLLVHAGQTVTAGQQIAAVGSDGDSTGCHLHLEVRTGNTPINPVPFLADRGVTLGALVLPPDAQNQLPG